MPFDQHPEIRDTKHVQQTKSDILVHIGACFARIVSSEQRKTRSRSAWLRSAGSDIVSQRSDVHDN